jgi:DnaJ-class molecular chaperone
MEKPGTTRHHKHVMTYAELQHALHLFGLGERATLSRIKTRHRQLVKCHHPDVAGTGDEEQIRKINAAYRVLLEYVTAYDFLFSEEEFYEQNPEERIWHQFMDDQLWGKK